MKKSPLFVLAFIIIVFQLFAHAANLYAQNLMLNTAGDPPLHCPDQTGILDLLAKEAFGRINVKIALQYLPPERALVNANEGLDDGDLARIGGLGVRYPNLIQVPEKIFETDFVAFSSIKNLQIHKWEDLKPYDVAIVKGHKISEQNVVGTRSLVKADNAELLFMLLKNKRADIVVCERIFGLEMKKKLHLDEVRILEPPLASADFFIYLHKKHAPLVNDLAKALRKLREDGTYDRIYPRNKNNRK